ncbi:MAG: translation initiation factor IF-3 [Bacillota bacterium]|nr:translation initiation factor IF-3 [Bacillota bacterium]HPZ22052.1 translation initiation factor IF-3 [Bacillota bacterium]HQD20017.1 translation initiation factor IF-3 [Bacillota bacterium]
MLNEAIRAKEVRLVSEDGEQLGIMPLSKALEMAGERNLDLVNVAPQAKPPVCKLMDYGRFKYEQSKREKESRKKQHVITVKEVQLRPQTEEHDYQVKLRNAMRFLADKNKVKVNIRFRGRQVTHPEQGMAVCERFAADLADVAVVEKPGRLEGRNMIMILSPKQSS